MYYYLIAAFVIGIIAVFALKKPALKLREWFKERAPLIKKYWLFVVPFMLLNAIGYAVIGAWFYNEINFTIFGQVSATIFAVFVGYIAFSEFGESKFEKLIEAAVMSLNRQEFTSAKMKFEEAHAIKPKDTDIIADLLELYLILGMYDKFDNKVDSYIKFSVESRNQLTYQFLLALRSLSVEHIREARERIKATVDTVNKTPNIREGFIWSLDEYIASDAYRVLTTNTQKIISNYFAYLKRHLSPEQERNFVSGNYDNVETAAQTPPTVSLELGV
jgi:hypothetical protein